MAILRHEEQEYALVADLVADTLVPTANDVIYIEELKRAFRWHALATDVADDKYVIDQTSETANGRWLAQDITTTHDGTATTDIMPNGTTSEVDATITGVNLASANQVIVTNGDDLPAGVNVVAKEVVGDDTVRVVVENQTGVEQPAITLELKVLEF